MNTIVKRGGVCEEVVHKLQQQITSGRLKEGDKLPSEPQLMQHYGVGRSSIREAIRILANTGLLRVQQGLGTFVETPNGNSLQWYQRLQKSNAKDLNEVRQLLELKIAEKAAVNRNQKDILLLTRLLKRRLEAARKNLIEECIKFDIQFHIAIADAAKNDILADLYKTIAAQIKKSFTHAYSDTDVFIIKQRMHQDLLQSIIDKDPKKAWECVALITSQPG